MRLSVQAGEGFCEQMRSDNYQLEQGYEGGLARPLTSSASGPLF